jgi:tripartite-type tricarboxylate transporter receptor subunit TctC
MRTLMAGQLNRRVLAVMGLLALLPAVPLSAQVVYPSRPIKFITPFAPGGSSDTLARLIGHHLTERLGQTVVVESRMGAGGNIGADAVAKSPSDGHTLMTGSNSLAISAGLYKRLSYDPVRDLAPVVLIGGTPLVLVANPSFAAKSVQELIAMAKAKPGEIPYASSGYGTINHLGIELLKKRAGIDMPHVVYRASPAAMNDVISGHVPLFLDLMTTAAPHIRGGRVRALATGGVKRSPLFPDLMTMQEAGVPDFEAATWLAVFVTGGTPAPIIAKLHAEIADILKIPTVRERLIALGIEITPGNPEAVAALLKSDIAKWSAVIQDAGIAKLD